MDIRTIVVSTNEQNRRRYQQMVVDLGVECIAVANLTEMIEQLKITPFNGLLLDLPTLVKASRTEKSQCSEFLRHFPTIRLRCDEKSEQLRCLLLGSTAGDGLSLESFINEHCRPFKGRRIRRNKRMELHYNVLISLDDNFDEGNVHKSTAIDIAEGGCALITYNQWHEGSLIWLRFLEFEDQTPIQATICHRRCWGETMGLPVIGVRFDCLSSLQKDQILNPGKVLYERRQALAAETKVKPGPQEVL